MRDKHSLRSLMWLTVIIMCICVKGYGSPGTLISPENPIQSGIDGTEPPAQEDGVRDGIRTLHPLFIRDFPMDVQEMILHKPAIIFKRGHNNTGWSVIIRDSDSYTFHRGYSYYLNNRYYHEEREKAEFDTLSFIDNNISTLRWSFDSLAYFSRQLLPVLDDDFHIPWSGALYVVDNGITQFHYRGHKYQFQGPGSEIFNHWISKLYYIMVWLEWSMDGERLRLPSDNYK